MRPFSVFRSARLNRLLVASSLSLCAGVLACAKVLADDGYPRITMMETALLGKSFAQDALNARLSRLEIKAFGKTSDKAPLSDRTDALEDYVEKTQHKPLLTPAPGFQGPDEETTGGAAASSTNNNYAAAPASEPGRYPRVTALEQAIVGEVYEQEDLGQRLTRMETKAFGKASDGALGDRTDALEEYAEKKLHKKILGQTSTTGTPEQGGDGAAGNETGAGGRAGGGPGILAKMGGALLGLPVGGGPSFFSPGFGPFAGVRVRQRGAQAPDSSGAQTPAPPAVSAADEAIINSSSPPPPATRLATKVSWCEKRVFGQISDRHLPERLSLLNDALKFDPAKKGVDLMDDIDKLIKAAVAYKQAQ